jgi:ketopantoate reductase
MNRIYISGPMTGLPDFNRPAFTSATARLRALGLQVVNPVEINAHMKDPTWVACLQNDLRALLDCNVVVLLPDWQQSKGARLELMVARQLGMLVFEFDKFLSAWATP